MLVFSRDTLYPKYDRVYLLDKNRRIVWKYQLEYRSYGNIIDVNAPGDFDRLYITTERGYIICLDKSGQKIWETKLPNFKPSRISKDGKIVAAINIRDPYEVYLFERIEKAEEVKVTPTKTPIPKATITQTPERGEALHVTQTPGFDLLLTLATLFTASVILKLSKEN